MIINILHNHSCYPIKHITLEHWAMVFSLSQPFHDLEELQKDLIQTHWIVSYKALVFDKWKFSIATCVIVWQDYASYWEYLRINMFLLLFLHTIFGISWVINIVCCGCTNKSLCVKWNIFYSLWYLNAWSVMFGRYHNPLNLFLKHILPSLLQRYFESICIICLERCLLFKLSSMFGYNS